MGGNQAQALPPFFWPLGEGNPPSGIDSLSGTPVGHDEGTFLVLADDGSIKSVDPGGRRRTKFVNSSAETFSRSLELARCQWEIRRDLDEDAAAAQVDDWRRQLNEIDPAATAGPGNWWSEILEQCEDGLL
jgi:hypothetical protein